MPPKKASTSIPLVNAVFRTCMILERLAKKRSYTLEELSRAVGLAKPTAYRFLQTLQEAGYVRRDANDRYSISLKLYTVGSQALQYLDLYEIARPIAAELLDRFDESVHMGVLDGDSAVYVLKLDSTHSVCMHSSIGRRIPLHCTAIGKVLLTWCEPNARAEAVEGLRLVAHTESTITTLDALDRELEKVRVQGYALDVEEFEVGVRCMAAPIFDLSGSCVAAISVSRPRFRYDEAKEAEWAAALVESANRVSAGLGWSLPVS